MSHAETVLRYTPGQDYPFVHCKFRRSHVVSAGAVHKGMPVQLSLYRPWDTHHHLMNLEVVKMKCIEHHKVPSEIDPLGEAKYDGFVFEASDNPKLRWHNQYPQASYGQTTTDADHYLQLDWSGAGMSVKEVVAIEATDNGMTELQDGCHFLANIRRGRVTIAKSSDWEDDEKRVALGALAVFEVKVQGLIETAMGKKLKLMQIMYEPPADKKEPVLMDWFDVVFEDEPEFGHTCWEDGRGQRRLIPPVLVGVGS